jgi:hypothetical protein
VRLVTEDLILLESFEMWERRGFIVANEEAVNPVPSSMMDVIPSLATFSRN